MIGIGTRQNVEDIALTKGYTPIQVDGIPEGFSFKEPNITIGGVEHEGNLVAFIPGKDRKVWAINKEFLLQVYNEEINGK